MSEPPDTAGTAARRSFPGLALALIWLAAGIPAASVHAYPCFDVAQAQACWQAYAERGDDPDYRRAEADLRARLERPVVESQDFSGLIELSLAQLHFLRRELEPAARWAQAAARGCWQRQRPACELQARRFLRFAYDQLGRFPDAIWEAEKLYALSRLSGQPDDQVKAASTVAYQRLWSMDNVARALRVLEDTAPLAGSVEPQVAQHFENWRARAAMQLGYGGLAQIGSLHTRRSASAARNPALDLAAQLHQIEARLLDGPLPPHLLAQLSDIVAAEDGSTVNGLRALLLRRGGERKPGDEALLQNCLENTDLWDLLLRIRCGTALAIAHLPQAPERARAIAAQMKAQFSEQLTPEMALTLARLELRLLWARPAGPTHLARSMALLAAADLRRSRSREGARAAEFLAFMNDDHYWVAEQIAAAVDRGELSAPDALPVALAVLEAARSSRRVVTHLEKGVDAALAQWLAARSARPAVDTVADFARLETLPELATPDVSHSPATDFTEALRNLPPATGVVYFQWHHQPALGRRAWLLTRGEIRTWPLANSRELQALIGQMEQAVQDPDALGALLAALAEQLLPLAQAFDGVDQLVWIPDGELHAVPLAALDVQSDRITRARQHASLREYFNPTPSAPSESMPPIVFARPDAPADSRLPDLPASEQEAIGVARRFPGAALLLGADANPESALKALESAASWVHFAAHLELERTRPNQSGLVLSKDSSGQHRLTAGDLIGRRIPPKVVVLSSCESASGRRLTGEGVIGFSSTLLEAGASTVVANLWPVDDAFAATFINRWYGYLDAGQTIAAALQTTRRDFVAAGYPPSAWAGWLVLGDGAVGLPANQKSRWPWLLAAVLLGILAGIMAARTRRDQPN